MSNLSSCLIFCFSNLDLTALPLQLNDFVKIGCTGRMILKHHKDLLTTLQQTSPVQPTIIHLTSDNLDETRNFLSSCSSKMIIVHVGDESSIFCPTAEMWSFILECVPNEVSRRISMVFYPVELSVNSSDKPYSDIVPTQSYEFQECIQISDSLDMTRCAVYIEYEKHFTRIDRLETFSQALTQKGGNGTILVDHYCNELGFRLGLLPKYGA